MKILKKNSNRGILFLIILFLLTINVNAQTKTKVACIGNSVTYGLGISTRNVFSYPARLQFLLGKEYEVKN